MNEESNVYRVYLDIWCTWNIEENYVGKIIADIYLLIKDIHEEV